MNEKTHVRSRFRRLSGLRVALDDFGHGDAEAVLDENHFAARDEAVVHQNVDRFADLSVKFEDGSRCDLQKVADGHRRMAEHRRHRDRHVEDLFQIGCGPRLDRRVAEALTPAKATSAS